MSMNVSVGVIKTSDFGAHNRLEFRDWNTKQKSPQLMYQRMDRYFYLEYSQSNLEAIEKARINRQTSRRSTFLKLNQKIDEDQFVTEYLGIDGYTNKMSGHRERMTKKILMVYEKVTGNRLKKGEIPDRIDVDQSILQTPFGGLEVSFQLVQYIQQQRELSMSGRDIISEKLIQTYDNEILKWIWYWTIASHANNDKQHFDLFKIMSDRYLIQGDFISKLGRVITYVDKIKNERYKQLLRWHLIAYVSSALDVLLTEGDSSNASEEKISEAREILKMLTKPILDKLETKELKKAQLSKREQQIILVLYQFHIARIPQSIAYYQQKTRDFDLAWQMLIMPDQILFNVVSGLEEGRRKRIRKMIGEIHRTLKTLTDLDRQLTQKLDTKINPKKKVDSKPKKAIGNSVVASAKPAKKSAEEATIDAEIAKNKAHEGEVSMKGVLPKDDPNLEGKLAKLWNTIDRPFIVSIKTEGDALKVVCSTLQQILYFDNRMLYEKVREFLEVTRQSDMPPDLHELLWEQRNHEFKEKGSITPLQKIQLEELTRELNTADEINWDLIVKAFETNFGSTADVVNKSTEMVSHLLGIKVTKPPKETKVLDFLNLSYGKMEQVLDKMLEVGLLKTPHEKHIVITCWNVLYLW